MPSQLTTDSDLDALLRAVASTGRADEDLSDETLGGYHLEAKLGRGGMGVVYRARDLALDRVVAIKLLTPDRRDDPDRRARFLREARAAAKLEHPHVARIYGVQASGERGAAIVMELIEGDTLDQVGTLETQQILSIARQTASALAAAHHAGIVHRDLKPQNVMLTPGGEVKLLDFGLARRAEGGDTLTTVEGAIVGTPRYMSPEQARGDSVDARSDVFSFGAMLYELVAGRPAFAAPSDLAALELVRSATPAPLPAAVPSGLREVIDRCLKKRPEDRFADGAALLQALSPPRDGLSIGARPKTWRRSRAIAAAGALAACSVAALLLLTPGTGDRRSVRRIGFLGDRGPLEVRGMQDAVARHVLTHLVFERLVVLDKDGRARPQALSRFELKPHEGLVRLRLREGAHFAPHPDCFPDGRAADVEDLRATLAYYFPHLPGVEVNGDVITATVLENSPMTNTADRWALMVLLPRELVAGTCDELTNIRHASGSGPYYVVSRPTSSGLRLRRHERAPGAEDRFDELTFEPVSSLADATRRLALGDLDLLWLRSRSAAKAYDAMDEAERARAGARSVPTYFFDMVSTTSLIVRTQPPLDDAELREDLVRALDRQALASASSEVQIPSATFLPAWTTGGRHRAPPEARSDEATLARLRKAFTPSRPLRLQPSSTDEPLLADLRKQLERLGVATATTDDAQRIDLRIVPWRAPAPGGDPTHLLWTLGSVFGIHEDPALKPTADALLGARTREDLKGAAMRYEDAILAQRRLFPLGHGETPVQMGALVLSERVTLDAPSGIGHFAWFDQIAQAQ